eukprot:1152371-Pelagomonas_calceolata.AAC.4
MTAHQQQDHSTGLQYVPAHSLLLHSICGPATITSNPSNTITVQSCSKHPHTACCCTSYAGLPPSGFTSNTITAQSCDTHMHTACCCTPYAGLPLSQVIQAIRSQHEAALRTCTQPAAVPHTWACAAWEGVPGQGVPGQIGTPACGASCLPCHGP